MLRLKGERLENQKKNPGSCCSKEAEQEREIERKKLPIFYFFKL
jgi:hypothetical protein